MNKMIGKISKKDWSVAPEGATHTFRQKYEDARQQDGYYKLKDGKIYYWRTVGDWWDATTHSHLELAVYCVSKEEDLGMDKKEVKSVSDLTVGMFLRTPYVRDPYLICDIHGDQIDTVLIDHDMFTYRNSPVSAFESWSYTYNGEYTPIVKETEAEIKIKELEATIALAQQKLQDYKRMM